MIIVSAGTTAIHLIWDAIYHPYLSFRNLEVLIATYSRSTYGHHLQTI